MARMADSFIRFVKHLTVHLAEGPAQLGFGDWTGTRTRPNIWFIFEHGIKTLRSNGTSLKFSCVEQIATDWHSRKIVSMNHTSWSMNLKDNWEKILMITYQTKPLVHARVHLLCFWHMNLVPRPFVLAGHMSRDKCNNAGNSKKVELRVGLGSQGLGN